MNFKAFAILLFLFSATFKPAAALTNFSVSTMYNQLEGQYIPPYDVFQKGLIGFQKLVEEGKITDKQILTIIDFRLSSSEKRMWVVDISSLKVISSSYVSHGRNSGMEYAEHFSNKAGSFQSSLGFYVTAETYQGKHGLSLRLDGQEKGFNCNARERAIVLHSAEYASPGFAEQYGRLGRSLGCPAIPLKNHKKIIQQIKDGTAIFIYYPDPAYLKKSTYLNSFA